MRISHKTGSGTQIKAGALALAVAASIAAAAPARAEPVILNGNFEQLLQPGVSSEFGARFSSQQVTNWTTGGYNFVITPGAADTTGAANEYGAPLKLWGPGGGAGSTNYSNNGLPAASPAGGNYIASDGAFGIDAVRQTVTGLSPNSVANITFYYAGAQQAGYNGATTEAWTVSLGNESHSTPVLSNADHGFTGWQKATLSFVVTSATEVLSFLAVGTPSGVPPFSLLDGVTITQIPEPSTLALLATGAGLATFTARRRKPRR